jgi:hypothetical protein
LNFGVPVDVDDSGLVDETMLTTCSGDIIAAVNQDISDLIGSAPGVLDTLGELADAINDNPDYFNAVASGINNCATHAEITVVSGDLMAHVQLDFVDNAEASVISGAIVAQIPSLAGYATQVWVASGYIDNSEMTTVSGDIVGQIPSLVGYLTTAQFTTSSGDIVGQIPSLAGYVTDGVLTVTSGDIVAQIPSLAGYATTAQLTTASGDIVGQIPIDFLDLSDAPATYLGQINKVAMVNLTEDGLIFSTVSGGEGTDHAALANLDYASALHTGFQPAGSYITTAAMTTISGDIVAQIPAAAAGYTGDIPTISGVITVATGLISAYTPY